MGVLTALIILATVPLALSSITVSLCGSPLITNRIVGGTNAADGEWPWQIALYYNGRFLCGGSLIAPQWIMSAAHCFQGGSMASYTVYLGLYQLNVGSIHTVSRKLTRIITNSYYTDVGDIGDISLAQLSSPVNYTEYIMPICLPSSSVTFPCGLDCWVTGWGTTSEGGSSPVNGTLQEVMTPLINYSTCNSLYHIDSTESDRTVIIQSDKICAGYQNGGKDSCQGDSGGPLVCKVEGIWYQVGVVSWGDGCAAEDRPGVYTLVTAYQSWINSYVPVTFYNVTNIPTPTGTCGGDLNSSSTSQKSGGTCPWRPYWTLIILTAFLMVLAIFLIQIPPLMPNFTKGVSGGKINYRTVILQQVMISTSDIEKEKREWRTQLIFLLHTEMGALTALIILATVPLTLSSMCGTPLVSSRIVGGTNAADGQWPWQIALYYSGSFLCGGSLIAPQWIMSAAHCFQGRYMAYYTVYLGLHQLNVDSSHTVSRTLTRVIINSKYNSVGSLGDISLAQLSSPVNYTDYIMPICLPSSSVTFPCGLDCWITGWGTTSSGGQTPVNGILQEVMTPLIDYSTCDSMYHIGSTESASTVIVQSDKICSGYKNGGKDSCQGDSGGPLVCKVGGVWYEVGVVSWGEGCAASNRPGVYTLVTAYQAWINSYVPVTFYSVTNITTPTQTCGGNLNSTSSSTSQKSGGICPWTPLWMLLIPAAILFMYG
ncbi:transmembrane protease serine 9-like [Hyperolius riggenbachi]|uniref:transmembrane protease serine 9-like n=1 Tax=Hyperolius riggenbachi TaxID=752182 RepID=UPI0035A34152